MGVVEHGFEKLDGYKNAFIAIVVKIGLVSQSHYDDVQREAELFERVDKGHGFLEIELRHVLFPFIPELREWPQRRCAGAGVLEQPT